MIIINPICKAPRQAKGFRCINIIVVYCCFQGGRVRVQALVPVHGPGLQERQALCM